jgi:hypothetical protein
MLFLSFQLPPHKSVARYGYYEKELPAYPSSFTVIEYPVFTKLRRKYLMICNPVAKDDLASTSAIINNISP